MHLKKTYLHNLSFNKNHEFILLNYNSPDDMEQWVQENLMSYIKSGFVKYFKLSDRQYFDMPHAKNVSSLLSTKNIICNLDADNFLSKSYFEEINQVFTKNPHSLTYGNSSAGGRNCLSRSNFIKLGGYDEEMIGCARDDRDLRIRANHFGLNVVKIHSPESNLYIQHSDEIRVSRHDPALEEIMLNQTYDPNFVVPNEINLRCRHDKVYASAKYNTWKTAQNIKNGKLVANNGQWGIATVKDLFGNVINVKNPI